MEPEVIKPTAVIAQLVAMFADRSASPFDRFNELCFGKAQFRECLTR
jgi:hypothetical protein